MAWWHWTAAALLAGWAGTASAKGSAPWPQDLVCASPPGTVGGAMIRAGYQGPV